jgi:hypothetical protein
LRYDGFEKIGSQSLHNAISSDGEDIRSMLLNPDKTNLKNPVMPPKIKMTSKSTKLFISMS